MVLGLLVMLGGALDFAPLSFIKKRKSVMLPISQGVFKLEQALYRFLYLELTFGKSFEGKVFFRDYFL